MTTSVTTSVALLVNENAIDDIKIFLYTLQLWNSMIPTLYIYCTTQSKALIESIEYSGARSYNTGLDAYSNLSRLQMERMPSKQGLSNLFHDFTLEKCTLMEWAIGQAKTGVMFCDADLCWLGPLPSIPVDGVRVALSPHEIRSSDEAKYGKYNAGLLWIADVEVVQAWRRESMVSAFFEQLALDTVANEFPMYAFGTHVNYGWWRMFQGKISIADSRALWTIHRGDLHSGLLVKGQPVVCIHTHWKTTDTVTGMFNTWILQKLTLLKGQAKVGRFLRFLKSFTA